MSSQNRSTFQVRAVHALFVVGGALLGFVAALALVPDESAVGQALGTATIGSLALIIGQRTACEVGESRSAD